MRTLQSQIETLFKPSLRFTISSFMLLCIGSFFSDTAFGREPIIEHCPRGDYRTLGVRPVHGNYSWNDLGLVDWTRVNAYWLGYIAGYKNEPDQLLCNDQITDCSSELVELCAEVNGALCACTSYPAWNGIPDFNKKLVFLTIGDSNHRGYPTGDQISASYKTYQRIKKKFNGSYYYAHASAGARINPSFVNSCTDQALAIPCEGKDMHYVVTVGCGGNDLDFEAIPGPPEVTGGMGWAGRWLTFQNQLLAKFQDKQCFPGKVTLLMFDQPDPGDGGVGQSPSNSWLGLESLYGIFGQYQGVYNDNVNIIYINTQPSFTGHYSYCQRGWCFNYAEDYCGEEGCADRLPGGKHGKLTERDGIHQTSLGHDRAVALILSKLKNSWRIGL